VRGATRQGLPDDTQLDEAIVIDDPYLEFKRDDMILRDWLALDRTVLANKRTFLAYGRTAIAMSVLGIAFVKLIGHPFFEIAGFFLMLSGVVVFYVGLREYSVNTKRFKKLVEKERAFEAHMRDMEAAGEGNQAENAAH
jgi:putative membrane protein